MCRCTPVFFATLLAAVLFLLSSAHAQPVPLSPVVVTGSREPLPLDRLVGDVTVIDEKRIRDSSADSLESLLSSEGGVQLSRNGGPGQVAGVFLRGSSASSVVVLIDGVRIGSASLGQADLSGLSLASVERIEILRGPASSLYGADAVGGVVQIFTKRGEGPPNVGAHLAVGGLRSSEADVSITGANGSWDYAAVLSREASDGVSALKPGDAFGNHNPDRDGFRRTGASLRGGVAVATGHRLGLSLQESRLRSQYDSSEFLPPTFAQDATPDFRSRFDVRQTALDYRGVLSPEWTTSLQLSEQVDDSVSGATALNSFNTRRRQLTWQNAWTLAAGQQLVGAIERLNEAVESSSYTGPQSRNNTAVVLGYTGAFGAHKLQADVRHDRNSVYGNVSTGKLGWGMEVATGLTRSGGGGHGVSGRHVQRPLLPRLWRAHGAARALAQRRVGPAVARGGSVGLGHGVPQPRARPDRLPTRPQLLPCRSVLRLRLRGQRSRATLKGVTLTAAQRFGDFGLRAALDFLDATDSITGQRLTRRAANQQRLVGDWSQGPWGVDATLTGVGARPEGSATLGAYATLDLQMRYRLSPQWRVEAKLLNATDRQYETARDYQSVGRQAWLGVRFQGAGL